MVPGRFVARTLEDGEEVLDVAPHSQLRALHDGLFWANYYSYSGSSMALY